MGGVFFLQDGNGDVNRPKWDSYVVYFDFVQSVVKEFGGEK